MKSKSFLYLCSALLGLLAPAALHAQASVSNLVAVEENGPRAKQLNFVYLSEGFTTAEMGTFASEVQRAVDYLFAREPWIRYRKFCNVYRIEVPSTESGTSDPDKNVKRNTYFQSYYWRGIDRLNVLSETGETRAYNILNAFVPEYDVPIAIVNTTRYGGSGGPIAVATCDELGPGLVEHETGHSFALLGDEYDDETSGYNQFEFPNTTKQTSLSKVPWRIWIESGTTFPKTPENDDDFREAVGHFEGANYHQKDNYRAHDLSYMRGLGQRIGQVNREAILLGTYKRVALVNSFTPTAATQTYTAPATATFSVSHKTVLTAPAISVEWKLNGVTLEGETGDTISLDTKSIGNGTYTLKAIVRDPTDWIRKATTALVKEITWTLKLSNQVAAPVIINNLPTSRVLAVGSSLTLNGAAAGDGTITYQWLKNNSPLKPAVTTPTLTLDSVSIADAGTYSVKVMNTGPIVTQSCVVAVLDPMVPRVVVGQGKNATLAFAASSNLPPVSWRFSTPTSPVLMNGADYAGATTKALQVKKIDLGDDDNFFFNCGDFGPSPIRLLVVTDEPDFTGVTTTLPVGIVSGAYGAFFPQPMEWSRLPNSYAAKLPAGLKINPKTGDITGIPTAASKDQTLGDEITFTVGNEFGKVPVKIRLLIKSLPAGFAGTYSGLVLNDTPLGGATGGRIDLTVLSTGGYSGSAIIGTEKLGFSGVLTMDTPDSTSARGTFTIKPKHATTALTQFFLLTDDEDADPDTALINGGQFYAWRNKWLDPENPDIFKGYHTFAFTTPESSSTPEPRGDGFGSVTIDANGKTVLAGKLADGESFTSTSHLSPMGEVLVYQALYATAAKGSIIGTLDLDPGIGGGDPFFGPGTRLSWYRPEETRAAATGRVYRDGFYITDRKVVGGLYTAPVKPEILMHLPAATGSPLVNAWLVFAHFVGDDPVGVNPNVGLEIKTLASAKVTTDNPKAVTFSATPADGRFKGSYTTKDNDLRPPLSPTKPRPQISRKVDYQGIIIQIDGVQSGRGYFLRDSLPKADGTDLPTTSPRCSGDLRLLRPDN